MLERGGELVYVCFGTNDTCRSKLIRWVIEADYNHTWLEYPSDEWNGQLAVHSFETGVIIEPWVSVRKRYNKLCVFQVKADITSGMHQSINLIGKKYDYKVIWNMFILLFYKWFKWEWLWNLAIKDINKFTCSEFVSTIFKRARLPEMIDVEPEFVTPGDLFNICKKSKSFEML